MAKLKTGRHTSAIKAFRQSQRKQEHNRMISTKIHTLIKKVEDAVSKKDKDTAGKLLKEVFSQWDKAARKNVIHSNTAANQKARISKLVSSISGTPTA
ncbi:MAG: 30S ribosomal protein S20 [Elusimicrobia bacterium]|nr:30S ribosomal protein S20 [Candidatus Liberimonas magnetica]